MPVLPGGAAGALGRARPAAGRAHAPFLEQHEQAVAADRVMPPEHGRRLADLLPESRLVEVADSYTLIPLDQPARLASVVREFSLGAGRAR
jgi:hypothetical protein